jgi:hypothetical protein
MTSKFDAIRPYDDSDLPFILNRLIANDVLLARLVAFRFSAWPKFIYPFIRFLTRRYIKKRMLSIHTMREFQGLVEPYMQRMINTTTTDFNVSGFEQLDLSKPCLFISNHRDIALDPAFINWALHLNGQDTVRIAVGDNLLSTDWVTDLIRLNKCFIVNRRAKDRRQKLADAKLLSEYIAFSLIEDQQHIWIAQREGRAKDGNDLTNPAIISMLALNKPKEKNFACYINELRIVPVSISYEFDPCDLTKAQELQEIETSGSYDKADHEDLKSIAGGVVGNKGQVHVNFGRMLNDGFNNAKEVAEHLDKQILDGYQIFATAKVAASLLAGDKQHDLQLSAQDIAVATEYLNARTEGLSNEVKEKVLNMYAKPWLKKLASS